MKKSITALHFELSQEMKRFEFAQVKKWLYEKYRVKRFSQLDRDELENFLSFLREQDGSS